MSGLEHAQVALSRTVSESLGLFKSGLPPAAIALQRQITDVVVYRHLAQAVIAGQLELSEVVPAATIQAVDDVIRKLGYVARPVTLTGHLARGVPYGEVDCMVTVRLAELAGADASVIPPKSEPLQRVVTLGNVGSVEAVSELVESLGHSDGNVRKYAASALGKIASSQATAGLLRALHAEALPQNKQYIIKALGRIGDPLALETLESWATRSIEPDYVTSAAVDAARRCRPNRSRKQVITKRQVPPGEHVVPQEAQQSVVPAVPPEPETACPPPEPESVRTYEVPVQAPSYEAHLDRLDGLIGCKVQHATFGMGEVKDAYGRRVFVAFPGHQETLDGSEFLGQMMARGGEERACNILYRMRFKGNVVIDVGNCAVWVKPKQSAPVRSTPAPAREPGWDYPIGPMDEEEDSPVRISDASIFLKAQHQRFHDRIIALGCYYPPSTGLHDNWSRHILDLKDGNPEAIAFFLERIDPLLQKGIALACVPSHDPLNLHSGVRLLAQALAARGRIDATSCIVRTQRIEKLALGGKRAESVHQASLAIVQTEMIDGRPVLILDDITTTGNSLRVCRELLKEHARPSHVGCIALGHTERQTDGTERQCESYLH